MIKIETISTKSRLITGLILLFYAATHLLNHSMGIFGLEVMEESRKIFLGFWRNPITFFILPLSIFVHFYFVWHKLFVKKTFQGITNLEWIQLVFGILIPFFLVLHILSTRYMHTFYEVQDTYTFHLIRTFPDYMYFHIIIILLIWVHGSIGLHYFIKTKEWYVKYGKLIEYVGVILPVTALWGIVSAGREIVLLRSSPEWSKNVHAFSNPQNIPVDDMVDSYGEIFMAGYILFVVTFFIIRLIFHWVKKQKIKIYYLDGPVVSISKGTSILEASLISNIPHAHVCGGRGRCSTCRIRVLEGANDLPLMNKQEEKVLQRISAGSDVRLACQTMPNSDVKIHQLLPPDATAKEGFSRPSHLNGHDKDIAVLFSDLRGFTNFSEQKLPYDVVFILNRYFQLMGSAIESSGGYLDKFIGDGIMALFGIEEGLLIGCKNVLVAAKEMSKKIDQLNEQLINELKTPLQLGIGIHCGNVVVGEMGYKNTRQLTAIGDVVNTASRLESSTKNLGSQLVVSEEVVKHTGFDFSKIQSVDLEIRGKAKPLKVYSVKQTELQNLIFS
ncbi:MAG: 2Fe-2S iron-sulfur cluster binding domain-containing protein [Leptospiraceae bacterium]|nr:2Fe-2S iron-sulfur cluster binding domain-containing protein [Leptospiraceae bacterium]MCP5497776.1 2Fe-2S iron-sulfur cluster binding domain-containing protein [Leptospiraceae bacterium]